MVKENEFHKTDRDTLYLHQVPVYPAPGIQSVTRKENCMAASDLWKRIPWFVDPVPDWISKDPRWQKSLNEAVNFQLAQIDVQIKELTLERARLKKMLPREVRSK